MVKYLAIARQLTKNVWAKYLRNVIYLDEILSKPLPDVSPLHVNRNCFRVNRHGFISFLYKVDAVAKATHKQERASCVHSQKGKVSLDLILNKMTSTHWRWSVKD